MKHETPRATAVRLPVGAYAGKGSILLVVSTPKLHSDILAADLATRLAYPELRPGRADHWFKRKPKEVPLPPRPKVRVCALDMTSHESNVGKLLGYFLPGFNDIESEVSSGMPLLESVERNMRWSERLDLYSIVAPVRASNIRPSLETYMRTLNLLLPHFDHIVVSAGAGSGEAAEAVLAEHRTATYTVCSAHPATKRMQDAVERLESLKVSPGNGSIFLTRTPMKDTQLVTGGYSITGVSPEVPDRLNYCRAMLGAEERWPELHVELDSVLRAADYLPHLTGLQIAGNPT